MRGGISRKCAVGAWCPAQKCGEARDIVHRRRGTIGLIAAEHQTQIQCMPGQQHGFEALFHGNEIVAAIADGAAQRFAPDGGNVFAGQIVWADQRVGLAGQRSR